MLELKHSLRAGVEGVGACLHRPLQLLEQRGDDLQDGWTDSGLRDADVNDLGQDRGDISLKMYITSLFPVALETRGITNFTHFLGNVVGLVNVVYNVLDEDVGEVTLDGVHDGLEGLDGKVLLFWFPQTVVVNVP